MSLTEIEAQLDRLTPEELRHLAIRSWRAFVERQGDADGFNECDEDDPSLLAALDKAIQYADSSPSSGCAGVDIRERTNEWTSK